MLNVVPDPEDGVIRRLHLLYLAGPALYPALSLELFRLHEGAAEAVAEIDANGLVRAVRVGSRRLATDSDGSIALNYRGPVGTFPHLSVADLIDQAVPVAALAGKTVLVGATEVGIGDVRNTPVAVSYPGVEVHATALDNLLRADFFRLSLVNVVATVLLILLLSLGMPLLLYVLPPLWGFGVWLAIVLGYIGLHRWMVLTLHSWTSLMHVELAVIAVGAAFLGLRAWQLSR